MQVEGEGCTLRQTKDQRLRIGGASQLQKLEKGIRALSAVTLNSDPSTIVSGSKRNGSVSYAPGKGLQGGCWKIAKSTTLKGRKDRTSK